MAEGIRKFWTCDRCGLEMAEKPRHEYRATVRMCLDGREGPGPAIDWHDLCDLCNVYAQQLVTSTAQVASAAYRERQRGKKA